MKRIKINPDTIWGSYHHPVEPRLIKAGDVFEVESFDENGTAHYKGSNGVWCNILAENYTLILGEEAATAAPSSCTCDILTLMAKGCQCGAFKAEQSKVTEEEPFPF